VASETNDANILARLDALAAEVARTSSAAAETDSRTRDLFLLSVARRMLDAVRPLTPIDGAIEGRFRAKDPAAVDALAAWSAASDSANASDMSCCRRSGMSLPIPSAGFGILGRFNLLRKSRQRHVAQPVER
jgi:hypothetical protein